jgi:hypothetical protein
MGATYPKVGRPQYPRSCAESGPVKATAPDCGQFKGAWSRASVIVADERVANGFVGDEIERVRLERPALPPYSDA